MKQTMQEENRIWELLQQDPESGLKLAMEHYGGAVKWIAASILGAGAHQDVEECVAETFVRLWRNASRNAGFRAESAADAAERTRSDRTSLYSYTCGIARHVAVDMVRRRSKNSVSLETVISGGMSEAGTTVSRMSGGGTAVSAYGSTASEELYEDPDFTEQLVDKANQKLLWETVDQMTPPDREIFLLRYWMELRVSRIAKLLGLTEKQVENRLYRGRRALRKKLEERGIIR